MAEGSILAAALLLLFCHCLLVTKLRMQLLLVFITCWLLVACLCCICDEALAAISSGLTEFHKLQMRLHAAQVMLEQVQEKNQCLNRQVAGICISVRKMEAEGLLAKKEALKGAQEKHVFLESEIKSTRDVPGQSTDIMSSWWSQLSVAGSFAPSSTLDESPNSSVMTLVGLPIPPPDRRTTEIPSLAQSSGLTEALQRRFIAQPSHGTEMPSWNSASSRNRSLFMTVPGQRSFSPLFTDSRKIAQSLRCMQNARRHSASEEYQEFASSAIGNLKIAEVDQGGRFVKIRNHATKEDENIGGYLLKQDIKGQPVAVFRFPSEIRMEPNSTVTVWAADAMVIRRYPSDLLWKDLKRFRTSLDCTIILCEPSGQAVAWYTSLYWTTRQELMATGESEEPENIIIPTFSTTREQCEEEQESTMTDTEWNMTDPWQTSKKRPSFIKREKKTFASLFPNQSAWCQSPNTPTHPHFSLSRPLTMGNDGSSLCRQSRCQSSRPDPVPGTLYAGTSKKKNPSVPSCMREKGKSQPPQLAVEEEESQISSEKYDFPGCGIQSPAIRKERQQI